MQRQVGGAGARRGVSVTVAWGSGAVELLCVQR